MFSALFCDPTMLSAFQVVYRPSGSVLQYLNAVLNGYIPFWLGFSSMPSSPWKAFGPKEKTKPETCWVMDMSWLSSEQRDWEFHIKFFLTFQDPTNCYFWLVMQQFQNNPHTDCGPSYVEITGTQLCYALTAIECVSTYCWKSS